MFLFIADHGTRRGYSDSSWYVESSVFVNLAERAFKMMESSYLFYCDDTLGCRVIQDFDLCKLDDL